MTTRDELVDFRWSAAADGYTLVEVEPQNIFETNRDALDLPRGQPYERLSDIAREQPGRLPPQRVLVERARSDGRTEWQERRNVPDLAAALSFAAIRDEQDVLSFADRYGSLGRPEVRVGG